MPKELSSHFCVVFCNQIQHITATQSHCTGIQATWGCCSELHIELETLYCHNCNSLYSGVAGALSIQAMKAGFQFSYCDLFTMKTGIAHPFDCFDHGQTQLVTDLF